MKSPNPNRSRKITASAPPRCAFSFSDGRRCAMLCRELTTQPGVGTLSEHPESKGHPSLCLFHARVEQHILEADRVVAAFTTTTGGFYTVNDVNQVLGSLFRLVAANRMLPRTGATLAYIGQLLLHSIRGVEREINLTRGNGGWARLLSAVLNPRSGPKSGPVQ
jgi:hypothetical protein